MKKIKLGLVDDHNLFRKGVLSLLEEQVEFEVTIEAGSGESFLNKMTALSEYPDIVLCDIKMAGMMGYELTARISEKYPDVKVIALSMYADEGSIINMITSGACGYILKGAEPWELIQAIKAVSTEGVYLNEEGGAALLKKVHNSDFYEVKDHEREFLVNCCSEMSYREIGDKMDVSLRTIDGYRERLFPKIKVKTRIGAVLFAFKQGIYKIDG